MALSQFTPKDYYNSKNQGYYQFTTIDDIISNFMVSHVGCLLYTSPSPRD